MVKKAIPSKASAANGDNDGNSTTRRILELPSGQILVSTATERDFAVLIH